MTGKSHIVFGIRLLYDAMSNLSAFLAKEDAKVVCRCKPDAPVGIKESF